MSRKSGLKMEQVSRDWLGDSVVPTSLVDSDKSEGRGG